MTGTAGQNPPSVNEKRRLSRPEAEERLRGLHPDWVLNGQAAEIRRVFRFLNRNNDMMTFVMRVMDLASQDGVSLEVQVGWGQCVVCFSSGRDRALTEADFRGAARVDAIKGEMSSGPVHGTC